MLLQSDGEAGSLQLQRRRKRRVSGTWMLLVVAKVWASLLVAKHAASCCCV
jgi:hypothetical protein